MYSKVSIQLIVTWSLLFIEAMCINLLKPSEAKIQLQP